MASRDGWEPEPTFSDALCGPTGMADPVDQPLLYQNSAADFFPDALSAEPLPALPTALEAVASAQTSWPAAQPAAPNRRPVTRPAPDPRSRVAAPAPRFVSAAARPVAVASARPARPAPMVAPAYRTGASAPGYAVPGMISTGAPPAGPPGIISASYQPSAVAPPSGRRPTAGTGYVPVTAPGGPTRPSAVVQSGARRNAPAPRSRAARKGSNAWGFLVFLMIVLFASGLGQKIIAAVTEYLQRK